MGIKLDPLPMKLSINISELAAVLLEEYAGEVGLKRAALAAHLVELCLAQKYPTKMPSAPALLPGGASPPAARDVQIADLIQLAINLRGNDISPEAFAATAVRGHFERWASRYAERVQYFADSHGLSWPQSYALLTQRSSPYTKADLTWAKELNDAELPMHQDRLLNTKPKADGAEESAQ